ncbi:sigma factor-like helix-turn-helix DNA-binding protein [Gemmata massiliana]|uniref:sigma factor-like helix-turn-helix DNA-binding protein n=1 Tax=Gemmata massiliana TaxID=1210884 RepID=UPI0036F197DE
MASAGVPLVVMRAAIGGTDRDGVVWSLDEWERIWARLTPTQQEVVYWHVLRGFTHTRVAHQLGIGRGAVDGAWRRALDRIRDALAP